MVLPNFTCVTKNQCLENTLYQELVKKKPEKHSDCFELKTLPKSIAIPVGIYMFKFNNRNTRTRCEICSQLTTKTPERRQWRRSDIFIVNSEHI